MIPKVTFTKKLRTGYVESTLPIRYKKFQLPSENSFPVGAELFHADELTDMTGLRVAFRAFAKGRKNHYSLLK